MGNQEPKGTYIGSLQFFQSTKQCFVLVFLRGPQEDQSQGKYKFIYPRNCLLHEGCLHGAYSFRYRWVSRPIELRCISKFLREVQAIFSKEIQY